MNRALIMLLFAVCCSGCGGSGGTDTGSAAPADSTSSGMFDRYSESSPLIDNSGAEAYNVLIMGNSHAAGLFPMLADLMELGQSDKPVNVQLSSSAGFLIDRVNDGFSEQTLEREPWTHVILQAQKYSTTGVNMYPTDAAEYWIRGSKLRGATPIMFPEHPRRGNTWEGQTLWDLHKGIADRENSCVAPVGLVWDEVLFRAPFAELHQPDGNHATPTGSLLTALVFYPIITGEPVESLPGLGEFGIDPETEQVMKESVSSVLFLYPPCNVD